MGLLLELGGSVDGRRELIRALAGGANNTTFALRDEYNALAAMPLTGESQRAMVYLVMFGEQ